MRRESPGLASLFACMANDPSAEISEIVGDASEFRKSPISKRTSAVVKAMSHETICRCNLQCNFCRKKILQVAVRLCQTYATCFATCNEIIFYARRVFKNVSGILIMSYRDWFLLKKNCETSCSGGVTRCNLSRSIAKIRSCFYFLCNLQRDFSLRD